MSGWIKIHRQINKHWVWDNPDYLKAWMSLLINVNHEEKKVLIDGELLICKSGESLNSVETWVKVFGKGWTRQKVRTFFKLLENDSMINLQGLRKTTKLTVCKYSDFQHSQPTDNQQPTKRKPTDNQQPTTTKESKEIKENNIDDRKLKFADTLKPFLEKYGRDFLLEFYGYWTEPNPSNTKFRKELQSTWELELRLSTWAKNDKNFKPKTEPKKSLGL